LRTKPNKSSSGSRPIPVAAEAISAHVDRELQIIDGIKRDLVDVEAGRSVPQKRVMAEARQIIAGAKKKRAARG